MDTTIDLPQKEELKEETTLAVLEAKIDIVGQQLNWLIENLQSLFVFVNQVGSNGGGIRGMLKALKTESPQLLSTEDNPHAG